METTMRQIVKAALIAFGALGALAGTASAQPYQEGGYYDQGYGPGYDQGYGPPQGYGPDQGYAPDQGYGPNPAPYSYYGQGYGAGLGP
jgi:hypothetical protein